MLISNSHHAIVKQRRFILISSFELFKKFYALDFTKPFSGCKRGRIPRSRHWSSINGSLPADPADASRTVNASVDLINLQINTCVDSKHPNTDPFEIWRNLAQC